VTPEVVSRWFGTFLVEGERVTQEARAPLEEADLLERLEERRRGSLTAEDQRILREASALPLRTTDRRLVGSTVTLLGRPSHLPELQGPARAVQRKLILVEAERALREAWDPSIHIEEGIHALDELDRILNTLGERLQGWAGRDLRSEDSAEPESAFLLATGLAAGERHPEPGREAPETVDVLEARRLLASVYIEVSRGRNGIEQELTRTVPRQLPNLSALLGPLLAARLVARAGGLDRLARLPASTVQVLGAERAFFEHLRGHGSPPRHGLLFLHPDIQGRPRRERGKVARALAGKVAIAARLDSAGQPLRSELASAFHARAAAIRARTRPGKSRGKPSPTG